MADASAGRSGSNPWELCLSKTKKKWFYRNALEKINVWEPPEVPGWQIKTNTAAALQSPLHHSKAGSIDADLQLRANLPNFGGLPHAKGAHKAANSLAYYYYNPVTHEACFDPPLPFP